MGFAKLSHRGYQLILFLFNCQVIRLLETQWTVALGHGVSPFGGIQHTPVDGCLAASCNPGVLTRDECMSFYSTIIPSRFNSKGTSSRQLLQKASPPTHTHTEHTLYSEMVAQDLFMKPVLSAAPKLATRSRSCRRGFPSLGN